MAAKKQSPSKKGKVTKSRKSNPSRTGTKKNAREEWEYQRKRFITAIIQFLVAVLFVFIYFMPGESAWYTIHRVYKGFFGIFGFAVPAILIFCAYQNVKDRPTYRFKLKTFLFALLVMLISATVYCFQTDTSELGGYVSEMHKSLIYASLHPGTGLVGAFLGYPLAKLAGSAGGGIIGILLFLAVLAFTLGALLINIFDAVKKPAVRVSEHISDNRQIRTEVRKRQNELKEAERKKAREEYIRSQVDKQMSEANKKGNGDLRKFRNKPFYESDQQPAEAQPKPKTHRKKPAEKIPEPPVTDIPEEEEMPVFADDLTITGQNTDLVSEDFIDISALRENGTPPAPKETPRKTRKNEPVPEFNIQNNQIISGHYIKPPFNLLEPQPPEKESNISFELNQNGKMLVETLKSFGVQTTIVNICRGPSVTRYELQPASGVKISKITNLADDIAMNLAATGVRIEAPIPGKNAVGIEVPNKNVSIVKMRGLVESDEFQSSRSRLTVALGMDITGRITLADISRMPHLLIAGSTGSGKSVCINSMLVSLLYKASPDEVKLLLIDPKVVELGIYNGIPHLLVPVVTDPRKAAGALSWAVNEMLNRYKTFAEYNVRDMHSYNRFVDKQNAEYEETANDAHIEENERSFEEDEMLAQAQAELNGESPAQEPRKLEKMPQIVIVIDELADLMMAASKEVEESICRLAQMARAAGMHLVIATQRPSVDVITGLIKANVPSRIAFAVKSVVDSRTILDTAGADKLLGRGDMLFSPIGTTKPIRVQGCYVDDTEIESIVDFIKKNKVVEYDESVIEEIERNAVPEKDTGGGDDLGGDFDPMMEEAIKCVVEAGQASTSMLQRRFRLGYARAGRLIDEMEQMGVIGPHEGAKPRRVLMSYQQWLERNMSASDE